MVFHGMEGTLIQEVEQVPEPPVQESSVASEGKKLSYDQDGGVFSAYPAFAFSVFPG